MKAQKANYQMKAKNIDLDVDYIGGQGALTDAEEKALSEFFKQREESSKKVGRKRTKSIKQSNIAT